MLAKADTVAVLTQTEDAGIRTVARGPISVEAVPNGIALGEEHDLLQTGALPTVLFCARLHPRKRVLAFAEMAKILIGHGVEARFVVAGPDEGDLEPLRSYLADHGVADRVEYVGALPPQDVRPTLSTAAVYVLPSEREPFPMTLLEAMAEGTPAVITDGCMIAERFVDTGGPLVTDGTPTQLAEAVAKLLAEPDRARAVSRCSRDLIRDEFSISAVVDQLEAIYTGDRGQQRAAS